MPPVIRLAAFELPHAYGEPAAALARVEALLQAHPGLDLVLLPELALTGYLSPEFSCDLQPFAEPLDGPTAGRLSNLARAHQTALAGPLVEREGDRLFNTTLVFDREGRRLAHYRKRHPWYPETWATPGEAEPALFEIAGIPATIATCFDAQFLADERPPALEAAKLLLFPSAWVDTGNTRGPLLARLARLFKVAILNANWGEGVPRIHGQGGSMALDATGRRLARTRTTDPRVLVVELETT